MQIIPAIDLRHGRVVRLQQGDYARETEYETSAFQQALTYQTAGAKFVHIVDLDAALDGGDGNLELIAQISQSLNIPIQTGGGVRNESDLKARFERGAARVIIGSLCVREPALVAEWLERYGSDRIVAGLDVRQSSDGLWLPQAAGWTESGKEDLFSLIERLLYADLKHILCTDIACDGMLGGPSVALYAEVCRRYPEMRIQASGGIGSESHLEQVAQTGVTSCIVGRALLEGQVPMRAIEQYSSGKAE
ncbi:MAG: 1-(5-phosphoribosyl)-5-[(5-phosphoribosylamino)methylideneamino] imidazole-4-carboxamide isomerase [Pseudomonadota bacterium]